MLNYFQDSSGFIKSTSIGYNEVLSYPAWQHIIKLTPNSKCFNFEPNSTNESLELSLSTPDFRTHVPHFQNHIKTEKEMYRTSACCSVTSCSSWENSHRVPCWHIREKGLGSHWVSDNSSSIRVSTSDVGPMQPASPSSSHFQNRKSGYDKRAMGSTLLCFSDFLERFYPSGALPN